MKQEFKEKTLTRLKKALGHLQKVVKLVEEEGYCIDIIQQNLAVQGHLKSANAYVLENHMNTCVKDAMSKNKKNEQEKIINEILKLYTWQ